MTLIKGWRTFWRRWSMRLKALATLLITVAQAATANAVRLASNQLEGQGAAFYRDASNLNAITDATMGWTPEQVQQLFNDIVYGATDA